MMEDFVGVVYARWVCSDMDKWRDFTIPLLGASGCNGHQSNRIQ